MPGLASPSFASVKGKIARVVASLRVYCKMFKAVDLSKLVTFFAIFHNDKPVDWLLDHMIQTKVCRFDRDSVSIIFNIFQT
ncbi:UNVERIFIED_CONTAM: Mgat4b [Trichonephila clavipes]